MQIGIGSGNLNDIFVHPPNRPIIHNLAPIVAPGGVEDLPHLHSSDIPRDDPIDMPEGIRAANSVLEEGGNVDQRRRVADGEVLMLVCWLIMSGR